MVHIVILIRDAFGWAFDLIIWADQWKHLCSSSSVKISNVFGNEILVERNLINRIKINQLRTEHQVHLILIKCIETHEIIICPNLCCEFK